MTGHDCSSCLGWQLLVILMRNRSAGGQKLSARNFLPLSPPSGRFSASAPRAPENGEGNGHQ